MLRFFPLSDYLYHWIRPVMILICAMLLFNLPTLIYKIRLTLKGILYLLFCNDKKWTNPREDPGKIFGPLLKKQQNSTGKKIIEIKTLYLVRHGESTWNDTFNKGTHRSAFVFVLGYIPGLIKSLLYELYLILSGKMDSWFYDSPLSYLGLQQVDDLAKFLKKYPSNNNHTTTLKVDTNTNNNMNNEYLLSVLRSDPSAPKSKMVASNLRRAISTLAGGFRLRLSRRPEEKILVLPSLQEISRNPDTLSITPPHTPVSASWIDKDSKICDFRSIFTKQLDVSLHTGNKPIDTNGLKRMTAFCDYIFQNLEEDHVVVGGHSIWFRSFFRTFLPYTIDHKSKTRKIVNCGIIAIRLMKTTTTSDNNKNNTVEAKYMIDPQSITVVYGGFT